MIKESIKSKNKTPHYKTVPFALPAPIQAGIIDSGEDHSTRLNHLAALFLKEGAKVAVITDDKEYPYGASTYNIPYSKLLT